MGARMVNLDEDLAARLEALAKASGQELGALVSSALQMFVDDNDDLTAAIEEGAREADQGELLDYDDVKAELVAKMAALRA